jgi:hypothetical protein
MSGSLRIITVGTGMLKFVMRKVDLKNQKKIITLEKWSTMTPN